MTIEVIHGSKIFPTEKGVYFLGEIFTRKKVDYHPSTGYCSGCALYNDESGSCRAWVTRIGDYYGESVLSLLEIHLGACGPDYTTPRTSTYQYAKVPEEVVEPGENGYVPDKFLPGEEIHSVTKILCK